MCLQSGQVGSQAGTQWPASQSQRPSQAHGFIQESQQEEENWPDPFGTLDDDLADEQMFMGSMVSGTSA